MSTSENIITENNNVWIISKGREVNLDLGDKSFEKITGPIIGHRISEFARYLLNPEPIEIEEKVVGCKVHYKVPASGMIKRFFEKFSFRKKNTSANGESFCEEILLTPLITPPTFRDETLNEHFIKINEQLMPFQPIQKKLTSLDLTKVEDITAIGEDICKNQSQIKLNGGINDRINLVLNSLTRKAKLKMEKSYLKNGLFDLRGYLFESFNPRNDYPLIKCIQDSQTKYCVLSRDYKFDFWVEDAKVVDYLHLFAQSIQTDPELEHALNQCIKGLAKPLNLLFSEENKHRYSDKNLPMVYRKMMFTHNIAPNEIEIITDTLKSDQNLVFFNYVPMSESGRQKLCTNVSVMHDVKALDSIKDSVPHIYSEIIKKTTDSDVGKLYLLDSIKGSQNV